MGRAVRAPFSVWARNVLVNERDGGGGGNVTGPNEHHANVFSLTTQRAAPTRLHEHLQWYAKSCMLRTRSRCLAMVASGILHLADVLTHPPNNLPDE